MTGVKAKSDRGSASTASATPSPAATTAATATAATATAATTSCARAAFAIAAPPTATAKRPRGLPLLLAQLAVTVQIELFLQFAASI